MRRIKSNSYTKNRGHWSNEEHQKFIQALQLHGRDWKKIVEHVGSRSSNQVRSHAQKYFLKLHKMQAHTPQSSSSVSRNFETFLRFLNCDFFFRSFLDMRIQSQGHLFAERSEPVTIIRDETHSLANPKKAL